MTKLRISLPTRELLITWSHPWLHTKKQGIENVFTKISQCFVSEYKGESVAESGRTKPRVRFLGSGLVKWPLYSYDGTPGHTYNTNGDFVSKARGRKMTLKLALEKTNLSTWERTRVWHVYLRQFHPEVPIPPALPALPILEGEVIDKVVIPFGRGMNFPPLTDPRHLLLLPASKQIH